MDKKRFKEHIEYDLDKINATMNKQVDTWGLIGYILTIPYAYNLFKFNDFGILWLYVPWIIYIVLIMMIVYQKNKYKIYEEV